MTWHVAIVISSDRGGRWGEHTCVSRHLIVLLFAPLFTLLPPLNYTLSVLLSSTYVLSKVVVAVVVVVWVVGVGVGGGMVGTV